MNAMLWQPLPAILAVWVVCAPAGRAAGDGAPRSPDPYEALVAKIGQEFLTISKHVDYRIEVTRPRRSVRFDDGSSRIRLKGAALDMSKRYTLADLATGLWCYLDDPDHVLAASVILYAKAGETFMGAGGGGRPGNGESCKVTVRRALGQPEWWYPHPVLFDRGRVLAESKTNAVVRAAHIEAMVKALADPKIRTENPLEANNILLILDALKAREAVQTFVDYMFYDWRTGGDYRLREGDLIPPPRYDPNKPNNLSQVQLPAFMYLPRLGDVSVPLVLHRIANATAEERSVDVGGGAAPAIVIEYFRWLRFTEQQALDAIADYQSKHEDLSEEQKTALEEVAAAIREKKYRTDALLKHPNPIVRTWAPSYTNAPPISRP